MITTEMIAPCGLDCSLCSHAHDEVNPCPGCNGPDEQKYDYCRTRCGIICVHTGLCTGCGEKACD